MDWQKKFFEIVTQYKGEASQEGGLIVGGNVIRIVCPKDMPLHVKGQIRRLIPENLELKYEIGPKKTTLTALQGLLHQIGVAGSDIKEQDRHLSLKLDGIGNWGQGIKEDLDWAPVNQVIARDGYFDSWEISLNGKTVMSCYPKVSEEMEKNQNTRDQYIQKSDILDLQITLGTCNTIEELLEKL